MSQNNRNDYIIISWKNFPGNKFVTPIQIAMLGEDGIRLLKVFKPVPHSLNLPKEAYKVQYDREYVIEKIKAEILAPLYSLGFHEIQKIISEAWRGIDK